MHLVDLDGAREGKTSNLSSVAGIVKAVEIPCELGGGIRNEKTIRELLDLGVDRLVIGTTAVKNAAWFRSMCSTFPGKLVLGIDARDGRVATDGWLKTSNISAIELAQQFAKEPIAAIIYTDIETDGMMAGPNIEAMTQMKHAVDLPVVASGGVSCVADVEKLANVPMAGCIIGRALYDKSLTLKDALVAARKKNQ